MEVLKKACHSRMKIFLSLQNSLGRGLQAVSSLRDVTRPRKQGHGSVPNTQRGSAHTRSTVTECPRQGHANVSGGPPPWYRTWNLMAYLPPRAGPALHTVLTHRTCGCTQARTPNPPAGPPHHPSVGGLRGGSPPPHQLPSGRLSTRHQADGPHQYTHSEATPTPAPTPA